MRLFDQRLRLFARQAGQRHGESCLQLEVLAGQAQVDLCIDGGVCRQCDLQRARGFLHRAFETGRPAGGEQLLGIGAGTATARRGERDVELAVVAAGMAFAAADDVGLSGVQDVIEGLHGELLGSEGRRGDHGA